MKIGYIPYIYSLVEATVTGIQAEQSPVIRISAVRAIGSLCEHLSQEYEAGFKPYLGPLTEGLVSVSTMYSTEVLSLCLDTLVVVLKVNYNVVTVTECFPVDKAFN